MFALVACKYVEDPIKNAAARVAQRLSQYKPMGATCCHGNQSSDLIWPKT